MDNELLLELVNYIKEVSPHLWEILLKQVYVRAWTHVVWTAFFFISSGATVWMFVHGMKQIRETKSGNYLDTYWSFLMPFVFLSLLGLVIATIACGLTAAHLFANPEYHAIRILLSYIPGMQ